jgi:hypothetical protein
MAIKQIFRKTKSIYCGIFAILYHYYPQKGSHYDILFEDFIYQSQLLITFNVHTLNSFKFPKTIPLKRIKNHRRIYLTYEGKISHNRGNVVHLDTGQFLSAKIKPNTYFLFFRSLKINGSYILNQSEKNWSLHKLNF